MTLPRGDPPDYGGYAHDAHMPQKTPREMKKLSLLPLILTILVCIAPATAQTDTKQTQIDTLRQKLATAATPADSLKILYDIFDLSQRKEYPTLAKEMYAVATRAGDISAQLDIARQVTAVLRNDKDYAVLEDAVKKMPESDEQKETLLFVRMKRVSYLSGYLPEAERQKEITKFINDYGARKNYDKYEKVLGLFTLIEYLRNDAVSGDMLKKYIDNLYDIANSEEFKLYAIPNIICAESANAYTAAENFPKALQADRKLLDIISGLEKKYASQGRAYRNYDISRFVCYRRMLRNYEALAPGEADALYGKILKLARTNSEVSKDLETNPMTGAFHLMATGDYEGAIPKLKEVYAKSNSVTLQKRALELLVKAAEQTGDDATRLEALTQYNTILEEYAKLNAAERYREMQVRYDIKELQERNTKLELEASAHAADSTRRMMGFVIAAFLILALAFALTIFYWTKFSRNSTKLALITDRLSYERDKMRQALFYDSTRESRVSFDSFDKWKKKCHGISRKYRSNAAFMAGNMINDLLLIATLGKENRQRHIQEVSVDSLMRSATLKAEDMAGISCEISINSPDNDIQIISDKDCLIHIIALILYGMVTHRMASKKISLDFRKVSEDEIEFIFTAPNDYTLHEDTDDYKSFITPEEMAEGSFSGIFIDRCIALLLSSDFKSDTGYKGGARFFFITPTNLRRTL